MKKLIVVPILTGLWALANNVFAIDVSVKPRWKKDDFEREVLPDLGSDDFDKELASWLKEPK